MVNIPSKGTLDITWSTILKISIAGLTLYILFLVKDILIWVLFGFIISILFDPLVDLLQRFRIPRVVGVIVIYLAIFGFIALSIFAAAPFFLNEIQRFSQLIPQYFNTVAPPLAGLGIEAFTDTQTFMDTVGRNVEGLGSSVFSALFAVFGGLFSTLFVISIAIFLSIEEKWVERIIRLLFPKRQEALALNVWERSQRKVSGWFLARVLSSIFVGVATYFALLVLNVQYPVSLAIFSGVLNFIPIVGPLFAGAIIVLVVSLDSTLRAIFVALSFILIQQIENNILTPILTKRFIGLPPAIVLIALAIGGQLWGIMGAILAVPLAGIFFEFLRDFLEKRKAEKEKAVVL
ncbi:MAG TPA: AI-2E family transporter [Candidatus Wildermuthbacteria bacterium]|nr:AI-2E family transporter [Candidatus Wildermuthbacteria bacterium]